MILTAIVALVLAAASNIPAPPGCVYSNAKGHWVYDTHDPTAHEIIVWTAIWLPPAIAFWCVVNWIVRIRKIL